MPTLLELPVPEMGPRLNSGELYFRVHAPFFPAMPDQSSKGSWRAGGRQPPLHRFGFRSAALPSIALPCGRPAARTVWHDARCGTACFLREFVGRFLIALTRELRPGCWRGLADSPKLVSTSSWTATERVRAPSVAAARASASKHLSGRRQHDSLA